MSDTRNFVIAISLSVLIIVLWQFLYEAPRREQALKIAEHKAHAERVQEQAVKAQLQEKGIVVPGGNVTREAVLAQGGRLTIDTPSLSGSLALKGARFDDITLSGYKESLKKNAKDVVLLAPSETKQAYFAQFGWVDPTNSIALPDANTVWQSTATTLTPDAPVMLFWDNGSGQEFRLQVLVDKDYLFQVRQSVRNYSDKAITLLPYGLLNRVWHQDHQAFAILHEGPLGVLEGKLNEYTYKDLAEERRREFKETPGWVGISDKYWLTAIIPDQETPFNGNFSYSQRNGQDRFQSDVLGQEVTVKPGEASSDIVSHMFIGAKKIDLLDRYGEKLNAPLFDRALDFGFFYFITKPLFLTLKFFHGILGNFGLAILLLTVCVKLAMFPLANKSYTSIHHMKRLQPEITRLRELYKDNKTQLNQEVMQLYKREKINPLSGCLPLLVQIPVFFSLYKVLFITIEMRHAPFYGWIKDLSAPDPTHLFNLFGLIPWDPPAMLAIGAWPIIMGITMILQQRMNPEPSDPTQAMVMKILPYIFIFIFASFPAGLIIYWAWNNALSLLQQWFINARLNRLESK